MKLIYFPPELKPADSQVTWVINIGTVSLPAVKLPHPSSIIPLQPGGDRFREIAAPDASETGGNCDQNLDMRVRGL